ncbi:MAG: response regulator transcription factor [Woeseiaceae bacterium]|nr:response regulator transcription factor [Woeseiaceae bacterium]MDX2608403.1 response regulator transcription factor [Woeseiaceae bacterium]
MDTIGSGLRVAILEDDPDQSAIVSLWLKDAGYSVNVQPKSTEFIRTIRRDSFDLYLLDWVVPELSGIEVLRKLRNEMGDNTPVIVATVKDKELNIVRALDAGADDYIVKPMKQGELLARVAAVLRRAGFGVAANDTIDVSPYVLDVRRQLLSLDGEEISLTNREFELAVLLFRNAGKLLSRSHILEAIWGMDNSSVSSRTVDTHVSRLRKKLNLNEGNGWKLTAVYQHGYRIERVN